MNTINNNGISVCQEGQENYTTFNLCPRPRRKSRYIQYDYRINGKLFSCVAPTLEQCREKRDIWLMMKSAKVSECAHYIPANYSTCSTCEIGGYCNVVCAKFQKR